MQFFEIIVDTNNPVSMAVFQSAMHSAVANSDSRVPDSLGDRLFCSSLRYSWHQRRGPVTDMGLLSEACELMNQYAREKFVALHPGMKCPHYTVI